ncbi:MAG: hypothetical protein ACLFRB_06690 [Thiohalorhabdus sp.]|uniref:hypothetical protein n=1 Tax=Thiohalorhabdus sp. TaxID=3094134 RepID=UPI00397E97A0
MPVWVCVGCGGRHGALPPNWPRYEARAAGPRRRGVCGRCGDLYPHLLRDWDQEQGLADRVRGARAAGAGEEA